MWDKNCYLYSIKVLRVIALNYTCLYDGLSFRNDSNVITNPLSLAEFKADFDTALIGLGRGCWVGAIGSFKEFCRFSRLQRIVIADIMGVGDSELTRLHFDNIQRLQEYAYHLMKELLNKKTPELKGREVDSRHRPAGGPGYAFNIPGDDNPAMDGGVRILEESLPYYV